MAGYWRFMFQGGRSRFTHFAVSDAFNVMIVGVGRAFANPFFRNCAWLLLGSYPPETFGMSVGTVAFTCQAGLRLVR